MLDKKKIKSFEDLEVWQLSHALVIKIYEITKTFPKAEEYRITSQLIRSASSIPANIAEGMGRCSRKEFIQYLIIDRGSLEETRYFIILCKDSGYIKDDTFGQLSENLHLIGKKVNALIPHSRQN